MMVAEIEGGQAERTLEPGKATSQGGRGFAQRPTPKCHSLETFVWHHHQGLGGRQALQPGPGTEQAARAGQPQLQGGGGGGGPGRPSRLPAGGPRRERGREVWAELRGAGGAGPNHMAQTAQAARHLFLSLSRTSAPLPPPRRPLPSRGPTRD